jgi:DNA repair photolyase
LASLDGVRREVQNPRNPWREQQVCWDPGESSVTLRVQEVSARSIVSKNDSPDIPFRFGLNPYQGCYHGCVYCYARPSHQYLGLGSGTDFERNILVKTNAPSLLEKAFASSSWQGEMLVFSGNTDCYQPLEAAYGLTRACLEVCLSHRNPVGVITKGGVALRDVSLLAELAAVTSVQAFISIPFASTELARTFEPFAAPIHKRFELLRELSQAGVSTGISISPLIPGANDGDVAELLARASAAGARSAFMSPLRLPGEVAEVFFSSLRDSLHPARVERIKHGIQELRGGKLNDSNFGSRMCGQGARWDALRRLFEIQCRRHGLNRNPLGESTVAKTFQRSRRQLGLFE